MSAYHNLLGRAYFEGEDDCFSLIRDRFREAYGVRIPNIARPSSFWEDPQLDLASLYKKFGFKAVIEEPIQEGDLLMMPLLTSWNSHLAVVVEGNKIIHHLHGQLSREDPLWPKWGDRAQMIVRHPRVTEILKARTKRVHLHEVLDVHLLRDPEFKEAFERVLDSHEGKVRDDYVHGGDQGELQLGQGAGE